MRPIARASLADRRARWLHQADGRAGVFRLPCAVRLAYPPVKHIHGVRHNNGCAFGVRVSAHPPFKARAQLVAWAKANTGERA